MLITKQAGSKRVHLIGILFVLVFLVYSCREPFDVKIKSSDLNALVVEGNINSGIGQTMIKLSRTLSVDTLGLNPESGAQVFVEGEDKSSFMIPDAGKGSYINPQLALNHQIRYRIHINTSSGEEYVSEFSLPLQTPAIDSLNWTHDALGVHVFVSTHDPLGQLNFYRWKYAENWEFHSIQFSYFRYVSDTIFTSRTLGDTDSAYACYHNDSSTTVLSGSSAQLGKNVISLFPLARVKQGDEKIGVRYCITVSQYAQSSLAYNFYENLKKNTELTGSIYSPQPSNLFGNIHALKGGKEAIGFVEVSDEKSKRLFISNGEVSTLANFWNYQSGCGVRKIPNLRDTILKWFPLFYESLYPLYARPGSPVIVAYYIADPKSCGNCRLRGSSTKPSFW